jgi:hypothetical protein
MKEYKPILVLVTLGLLISGCSQNTQDNLFDSNKMTLWQAKPFENSGELSLSWVKDIATTDAVMATPDAWYLELLGKGEANRYGIDPQTGEDKYPTPYEQTSENKNTELKNSPYTAVLGKTDGQYVYADEVEWEASEGICWRLSDGKMLWGKKNVNWGRYFEIAGGKLFYIDIHDAGENHISILNRESGEEIKTIKFEKDKYDTLVKDDYIWVANSKGQLMKIDTNTLDIQKINVTSEQIKLMGYFNNDILLYSGTKIYLLDTNKNTIIQTVPNMIKDKNNYFPDLSVCYSNGYFYINHTVDNKIDIYKYQVNKFVLNKTFASEMSIDIVNNQWIMYDQDIIKCVDPETLNEKWSVDLKKHNIDLYRVLWVDWRGVLISSLSEKVYCFR